MGPKRLGHALTETRPTVPHRDKRVATGDDRRTTGRAALSGAGGSAKAGVSVGRPSFTRTRVFRVLWTRRVSKRKFLVQQDQTWCVESVKKVLDLTDTSPVNL